MFIFLSIFSAWLYGHLLEYLLHIYLHKPGTFGFKKHFSEHHKKSRKQYMFDEKYHSIKISFKDYEYRWVLLYIPLIHLPILFFNVYFYITLLASMAVYIAVHARAHKDIHWARKYVPWHYDHHMAPNQHANWGIRLPIFDYLFGTRKIYKGTKKEKIKYKLIKAYLKQATKH